MIGTAILTVAVGVALVRLGWNRRLALAIAGWVLIAVAIVACARESGAWGMAVCALAGMATAFAVLLWSGRATPVRAWRPDRQRLAATPGQEPLMVVRRASVFLLVVPGGGIASLVFAVGVQVAGRRAGLGEADATACLLLLLPLLWASLLAWQMTRDNPRRMVIPPLLVAAFGVLLCAAR
ncbi:hypothetical protein [Sphingomonas bacterium]|uniref:hypothetical protein n=1 Tax=Sphingomonas bacterium TaxID=1895847 RepID=UPI001577410E|nr:hypothetical protein [Sphingomonas bacterium]